MSKDDEVAIGDSMLEPSSLVFAEDSTFSINSTNETGTAATTESANESTWDSVEVNGQPRLRFRFLSKQQRNSMVPKRDGDDMDSEKPKVRKFRWAVATKEEEQEVKERVWRKMEEELQAEESEDNPWDASKEHMLELVTRRRDIQDAKKQEELRKQQMRKHRSVCATVSEVRLDDV